MFLYVFGRFFVFHEALISAEKYISRSWAFGNKRLESQETFTAKLLV
jgi:hypothetical protein